MGRHAAQPITLALILTAVHNLPAPQEGALAGGLLANHCSGDLDESELGEPVLDVTLEVGGAITPCQPRLHACCLVCGGSVWPPAGLLSGSPCRLGAAVLATGHAQRAGSPTCPCVVD